MDRRRFLLALGGTLTLFVLVQLGALALVEPFDATYQPVDDPQNPVNSILYVAAILVATAAMLAAFKFDLQWLIRGGLIGVSALLSWYVLQVVVPPVVTASGVNVIAIGIALGVGAALYVYPEWYVIDGAGVLMGAGAAGLFGISFGLLPAIVLLVALAVYDAISVYGTEHMLTLADGVMSMRVPVVLVVPLSAGYSFLETDTPDPEEREERDALFIGLGDAVMPTIMVASAARFGAELDGVTPLAFGVNLPAIGAAVGTLLGVVALIYFVSKGRAHAGLPLLNGGAIGGYLVGALASGVSLLTALGL
jgi:presenilin-like A22 family membrane protease